MEIVNTYDGISPTAAPLWLNGVEEEKIKLKPNEPFESTQICREKNDSRNEKQVELTLAVIHVNWMM